MKEIKMFCADEGLCFNNDCILTWLSHSDEGEVEVVETCRHLKFKREENE